MPHMCQMCQLLYVHILGNQFSIYTLCELTAINNVTMSTGIHTFHITGQICSSNPIYMPHANIT